MRLAVEKALFAQAKLLGYTLKPENVAYDQDNEIAPFIEVYSLPNTTEILTKTDRLEYLSVYQLSLYVDLGKGRGESLGIIDEISQRFTPGSNINTGDTLIIFESISTTQARIDGNFYRADVSINYRAITEV